jgi:hypothetical protein
LALFKLGFRDELVVSPADGVTNGGNVQPGVVIGNDIAAPFRLENSMSLIFAVSIGRALKLPTTRARPK